MTKRISQLFFLVIFFGFLFIVLIGTLFSQKETTSFWENRSLASRPELTAETIWDGSFFSNVETYFSDHMIRRDQFLKLESKLDLLLNRPVVNELAVTEDVLLLFHGYNQWPLSYLETQSQEISVQLSAINHLVTGYGGYMCYAGLPQQYSYYSDLYPTYMDNRQWVMQPTRQVFFNALEANQIPYIDLAEQLMSADPRFDLYSTVDHHFTFDGALKTYEAIMEQINADTCLDLEVMRVGDQLTLNTLPNRYLGSLSRKLYDQWLSDEQVTIASFSKDIPFTRFDNHLQVPSSVFTLPSAEDELVTYSVYMGGDIAETVIKTDRPELPSALIVGESFTNAVETVLWASFDETRSLDLRHYTEMTLTEYIYEFKPDVVIFLRDESSFLSSLE